MAEFRIDSRMKVKTLKANFKKHLVQHSVYILRVLARLWPTTKLHLVN